MLLREFTRTIRLAGRSLTWSGPAPLAVALGRALLIRAVVGRAWLTLCRAEPGRWLFSGATGSRRGAVIRPGTVSGLFGAHAGPRTWRGGPLTGMTWRAGQIHRGPIPRLTKSTGLFERRITGAYRRSAIARRGVRSMTRRAGPPIHVLCSLVAVGVLSGRHPAFPRSTGRPAQGRVVVVVTPMSGIIVAHHASCTRRNPRIPPVR
ncbi:hypothetical protein [Nocardia sp. NPDC058114]|uniref:hypothetical protein n=1 Tax=Nocardia sp. NPDC058114 TaxID=3346346 RepID=UPI0036DE1F0B